MIDCQSGKQGGGGGEVIQQKEGKNSYCLKWFKWIRNKRCGLQLHPQIPVQEGKSEVKSSFPVSDTALVGSQPSVNIPHEHRECYLKEACYLSATLLLPVGVWAQASWGENYTTGGKLKSRRKEKPINNQHGYSAVIRLSPDLLLYSGNCICLTGTVSGVQAWIHSPGTRFERDRICTLETKREENIIK